MSTLSFETMLLVGLVLIVLLSPALVSLRNRVDDLANLASSRRSRNIGIVEVDQYRTVCQGDTEP